MIRIWLSFSKLFVTIAPLYLKLTNPTQDEITTPGQPFTIHAHFFTPLNQIHYSQQALNEWEIETQLYNMMNKIVALAAKGSLCE